MKAQRRYKHWKFPSDFLVNSKESAGIIRKPHQHWAIFVVMLMPSDWKWKPQAVRVDSDNGVVSSSGVLFQISDSSSSPEKPDGPPSGENPPALQCAEHLISSSSTIKWFRSNLYWNVASCWWIWIHSQLCDILIISGKTMGDGVMFVVLLGTWNRGFSSGPSVLSLSFVKPYTRGFTPTTEILFHYPQVLSTVNQSSTLEEPLFLSERMSRINWGQWF